jgi:hypothetical protein
MASLRSVQDGGDGLLGARTKALGQMLGSRKAREKESPHLLSGWVDYHLTTMQIQIQMTTPRAHFLLLRLKLTTMVCIVKGASASVTLDSLNNHIPDCLDLLNILQNDRIRRSRLQRLSSPCGAILPTPRRTHLPQQMKDWWVKEAQWRRRNE